MPNTALTIGLFAAEQLLKQSPQIFAQFQKIIAEKDVTVEMLRAKREAIAAQEFEQLVPNSQLPPEVEPGK
ncbi:MAG: hypothetical protein QM813_26375 [Verrucomicrobiota bacterium]